MCLYVVWPVRIRTGFFYEELSSLKTLEGPKSLLKLRFDGLHQILAVYISTYLYIKLLTTLSIFCDTEFSPVAVHIFISEIFVSKS